MNLAVTLSSHEKYYEVTLRVSNKYNERNMLHNCFDSPLLIKVSPAVITIKTSSMAMLHRQIDEKMYYLHQMPRHRLSY